MVAAAVGARLACSGGVRKSLPVVEAGGGERPLHTAGWFISRYTSKLIQYVQVFRSSTSLSILILFERNLPLHLVLYGRIGAFVLPGPCICI